MALIKNIEMLNKQVKNFTLANVKCMTNFNLSFFRNWDVFSALLDIDFIVESEEESYLVQFRFRDPQNIKLESLGYFHQVSLEVKDLSKRGWENIKFEVEDYENDALNFYCSEIEIISITKTAKWL
jgi:hypothetical protein